MSEYKNRIQNKFEGGKSISVDWFNNLQEAGEMLRNDITPPSLKRVVPLFGGLNGDTDVYYCPADVDVPSAIYNPRDDRERWEYQPPQAYHLNSEENKFTIETVNGVRFLLIRHAKVSGTLTVDAFDEEGSKTGVSLEENSFNYLSGDGAMQGTFSDALTDVLETLDEAIDITDYLKGVALLPLNFTDANIVSSVQLLLYTDDSNYYTLTSVTDSVGDHFIRGWNRVRFEMANATVTGTPTDTNITKYKLIITMETGESQTVIIDKISLEKTKMYNFEYYSKYMILDKDDNSWKAIADDDADIINLEEDPAGILVYEGAILVAEGATKSKAKKGQNFEGSLGRRLNAYWAENPSSQLPPMYSGSPNIGKTLNTEAGSERVSVE